MHTMVSEHILQIDINHERDHLLEYYHQVLTGKGNQQLHFIFLVYLQYQILVIIVTI
jgi:hypothetical protein